MPSNFYHISDYCQVGTRHQNKGIACQDAVQAEYSTTANAAIAVLSDGAGSCECAEEGANITVHTTMEILSEYFDQLYEMPENEAVDFILTRIREKMAQSAKEQGFEDIMPFSATLLCAVLADDGRYLYFHVGDGMIAISDKKGNCQVVSTYHHKIASNYTTFVTVEDTDYHFHKGVNEISSFLLVSDGPEIFLKYGNVLTGKGDLLIQLSYFYQNHEMVSEMQALAEELQKYGMTDDASFVLITDKRYAEDVFSNLSENAKIQLAKKQKSHP
ncbi:MAG: PP2C family serine/threonine-protein phosphatase [Oscillospiraceae bacterium]